MVLEKDVLKQHAPLGISAILGLFALMMLIYAGNQWYQDWVLAHQAINQSTNLPQDESAKLIAELPNAHLFGQNFTASGDVPVTSLQLRVTGIVKIDTEDNDVISKAYISVSGKPSKIYQTGDRLPDGVKIYAITDDTVILENEGRLEKLPLPREKLIFKPRDEIATA